MRPNFSIILTAACLVSHAFAASPDPVEIKRIEKRGKEIANYEHVAIRSTDLLLAMKPDTTRLGSWVAFVSEGKWWALYGRLAKQGEPEGFIASYAFSAPENDISSMRQIDLGKESPSLSAIEILQLARAASIAQKEPSPWNLPWNPSLFREMDGSITAYLLPGFKKTEDTSIGGDFRLSISQDGTKLLKKEPLHKSLIPAYPKGLPPGAKVTGSFHSHVLSDLPTETDVAFALLHPEFEMHAVMSKNFKTVVDKNGHISEMK